MKGRMKLTREKCIDITCLHCKYRGVKCFWLLGGIFYHGVTTPSGPGPPRYRGFTITLRHISLGRTPLLGSSITLRHTSLGRTPLLGSSITLRHTTLGRTPLDE